MLLYYFCQVRRFNDHFSNGRRTQFGCTILKLRNEGLRFNDVQAKLDSSNDTDRDFSSESNDALARSSSKYFQVLLA